MLILIVAEGPDKGRIYEWSDDQTVIVGRESKDLRLSDGKSSRQHARFTCEGGKWYVRDLASRHGTLVNKIRIDTKHPLNDGDRIRIGRTELVVARVPVEQSERVNLLGDQPTHYEAWRDLPTWRRFIPRASTAAAMTAAGFAIGCSAWLYMNSTAANQLLREDLLASQDRATKATLAAAELQSKAAETQLAMADRTDLILGEVKALGSSTPILNEILASIQAQSGNSELLGQIGEQLADMNESSRHTLSAILAGVESQSSQMTTLAEVRDMVSRQESRTAMLLPELQAVAATARANEPMLADLQKQIEKAQARPDLDAKMLDQLEAVVAELKARPSVDKIADEVRSALAAKQSKTDELLSRIESQLAISPDTQALVEPLREVLSEQTKVTERIVAEAFARQDHTAEELAELKTMLQSQPGETATALRGVIGEMEAPADYSEVLTAIKQIQTGSGDTNTLALLNDLAKRLESTPTSDQLADAVALAVSTQLDETRPLLEQIASSLDASSKNTDTTQALIDQLRLALAAQEDADTRLNQIYDLLASSDAGTDNSALQQVLREIRSKSIAGMDEMRSTIRREIQAGITEQRLASARNINTGPEAEIAPEPVAAAEAMPAPAPTTQAYTMAAQQDDPGTTQVSTTTKDGLTDVEHAYRLAFKTGKPITLGGGSIDPRTGKVTEGRTLDPSAAKAAGITDWRDWYLMDDFAERMRLQQQAMKFNGDRTGNDVLSIPADAKSEIKTDGAGRGY